MSCLLLAIAACVLIWLLLSILPQVVAAKNFISTASWKQLNKWKGWAQGLQYLIRGPQIIDRAYVSAKGGSFKVTTPSNTHLMITSSELINEVMDAPTHILSLHAVAKELLQPKYTMRGFEWQDQRGVEGTGFVRALRSRLTSHLPLLQPKLDRLVNEILREELTKDESGAATRINLFPMVKRMVVKINCFVFFGKNLSQNTEFTTAALEFPQTVILAAECLRITPNLLRPLVAALVTRRHRAARTLFKYLEPIVQRRLALRARTDEIKDKPVDCMQWLIDTSPRQQQWTAARMVGEIIAIWFSSVHQLAMTVTYAIEDICLHRDYADPLRQELREQKATKNGSIDVEELPLLDSFLKESIRYNNADAISCRRKALQDYILQDGSRIGKGDWVCIPQRAMMQDPLRYSSPSTFDGFRFARANVSLCQGNRTSDVPDEARSKLTEASIHWPIWGLGKTACPGRFYASLVLKLIVTQILEEWECDMPDRKSARNMVWRSSVVPLERTEVVFWKQQGPKR
ncbi:cytochrome P450 [Ustulina deusta]|nr:cytochrome P450 [Ustulina deusta]